MSDISTANETPPLGGAMIRGSAWMVGMRWGVRFIGIVNTAILARLLRPEDFGLIALAMIVTGVLEVFTDVGVDLALIRDVKAGRDQFDTAWTFRLMVGVLIGAMIFAAAPAAAGYFADPRVERLMQVLALGPVIAGFENIGIVGFRKELQYHRYFAFMVLSRAVTFAIAITIALILRNYWALCIGILAVPAVRVALSYMFHPYRPTLSLKAARELWSFSSGIVARSLGYAVNGRVDQIAVGKFSGAGVLGGYFVATSITNMVVMEVLLPLGQALLPGYAMLLQDRDRLIRAYLKVVSAAALLSVPVGLGLAAVANDFVAIVLGPQWTQTVPLIQIFAVVGCVSGISTTTGPLLMALNRVWLIVPLAWFPLPFYAAAVWFIVRGGGGIMDFAVARSAMVLAVALTSLVLAMAVSGHGLRRLGAALWRPAVCGLVMYATVKALHPHGLANPFLTLPLDAAVGAATYVSATLCLWWLCGRPEGAESDLLERFGEALGRRLRR
jgi:O-antigen/teichoic acid export membrane protein